MIVEVESPPRSRPNRRTRVHRARARGARRFSRIRASGSTTRCSRRGWRVCKYPQKATLSKPAEAVAFAVTWGQLDAVVSVFMLLAVLLQG